MDSRPLEITVASAQDLKDVNLFSKMDVYAVVEITGDPYSKQKQRSPVDQNCGTSPHWNYPMKVTVDEAALQQNRLTLKFELKSNRTFGDRVIGEVYVPIKELFNQNGGDGKTARNVSYSVKTPSGKSKGTLSFSYKFGEKFTAPLPQQKARHAEEPVMAYPPGYLHGSAASSTYPPPPASGEAGKGHYPYPYPYTYPHPPPPQNGYGAYPPPPGYGYYQQGYPAAQKPKKSGGGKMALGLGAGLLGGLLVGDMISDVGEMASYDAGYDAGFDDGFDF